MRLNRIKSSGFVAILLIMSFFLSVVTAKAVGYWRTESSRIPVLITEGEHEGEFNPADIRGSYSLADIESLFGIPPVVICEAFQVDTQESSSFRVKELEDRWPELDDGLEVGTDSVRVFVALWTGIGYPGESTTALPVSAVNQLLQAGKINRDQVAEFNIVDVQSPAASSRETTPDQSEQINNRQVLGTTSFGDIRSWNVSPGAWELSTGHPMGPDSVSLKDWADEKGIPFTDLKRKVQILVDAAE